MILNSSNCFQAPKYSIVLVFAVIAAFSHASIADERPGQRSYPQFSSWEQLEHALLSELRAVHSHKEAVQQRTKEYDLAREKYYSTESGGFLGFFDPKEDARERMDDARLRVKVAEDRLAATEEQIKEYLTSTPPGDRLRKLGGFKANVEAAEIRNALINVSAVAESLGMMLTIDTSDSLTAAEYYDHYLQLLGYLQSMHAGFIERADGTYYDYLKQLWGEWLRHAADMKSEAAKMTSQRNRELMQRQMKEANKVLDEMPAIIRGLGQMKAWAVQNLRSIRENKAAVSFLRDKADLATRTQDVVSDIDITFDQLDFDEPPLIEFSVDIEKIRLQTLPNGGV